ncbi:hypothetical protein MMC29_002262 [Sticta canariensis]|nr:hypothetical protein [Sticta canariensis]
MSMVAGFPGDSSLESIGSVAANFSRTEEEEERAEFLRYSHGSAMADMIRSMHGTAAYEAYLDEVQHKHEADAKRLAKQQARRKARSAAFKRACLRVKAIFA